METKHTHLTALEQELLRVLEDAVWASGYGVRAPIIPDEKFKVQPWILEARKLIIANEGA